MKNLGLSTFWDRGSFDSVRNQTGGNWNMVIIPLMGIFLFLITAMVFVAVAFIFVIRYIVLIILLILSPIAYMGSALPFLSGYSKDWWKALSGQLLFGPLYMIMTWIVLTLMGSAGFITGNSVQWGQLVSGAQVAANVPYQQSPISLVFNFAILIGLIIASLIVSKKYASQGSTQLAKITGSASSMAGSAVFGGTAWLGRKTMGNAGRVLAEDAGLQERADKGGTFSRLALYGARKARDGSYEARNATIPTSVVGDAIRGTVGRTEFGKAVGLNDVNTGNIPLMSGISETLGAGKGGTQSVMDERKESADRVKKREEANAEELSQAVAKRDIMAGKDAVAGTPEYIAFEKALSKMSEKETEKLVASNKELLDSQNFANNISVKQLEALNKSDLVSSVEKGKIVAKRFSAINSAMASGSTASISAVSKNIRSLSDSELEMLDPSYLQNEDFVSNMKPGQIDGINKGNRFTTTQRDALKKTRMAPLNRSLSLPVGPAAVAAAKAALKGLTPKEVSGLDIAELTNQTLMEAYSKQMLKRMAPELNPSDIPIIRTAITTNAPGSEAAAWLATPDGLNNFS